jgi:geranylgeranyl diphosphate synthase type II
MLPHAHPEPLPRAELLTSYLRECRELVLGEIGDIVPKAGRYRRILYDLMLAYPLRNAKALRPALCIATCRALGGRLEAVLRSAAVLELYHNAFLIHDDVEDGSEKRRDLPTLHREYGVPIAVNVGDAMLALALEPLLDNMRLLGLGRALRILQIVARMARESAEGQAIELDWIRHRRWQVSDADYMRMVYKKTSWYTFVAPVLVGGIVAQARPAQLRVLRSFASLLGIAFQIQDDVLNLESEGTGYGKERDGDLWEGKRTLILLHAMRVASPVERARARRILAKMRPEREDHEGMPDAPALHRMLRALEAEGALTGAGRATIERVLLGTEGRPRDGVKTEADVAFLRQLVERYDSLAYARRHAERWARRARLVLDRTTDWLLPSVHRDFLESLVDFVIRRDH